MKNIVLTIILAGLCVVGANAALTKVNGCYQIGNKEDLRAFAIAVNGGEKNACGQVTANIDASDSAWTPIMGFTGYFEGNGFEIIGVNASLSFIQGIRGSSDNVGFFGTVSGGAVIRNLKLTNLNIHSEHYVGGLIGNVIDGGDQSKTVLVDNCGVSGTVNGNKNIGGLVGNVSSGMTLIVVNSYNSATIDQEKLGNANVSDLGGLVGYVNKNATLTLVNDYNTGSAKTNPLVGNSDGSINATDVGCVSTTTTEWFTTVELCTKVVSDATVNSDPATACSSKLTNAEYQSNNVKPLYDASAVGKIQAVNSSYVSVTGVSIAYDDNSNVIATILDNGTALSIPQDIRVDKVEFARTFLSNKTATMVLPFDVADLGTVSGATFVEPTGIKPRSSDDVNDTIEGTKAESIVAYKPYAISPFAGKLSVTGAVTLKKTEGATLVNTFTDGWDFVATIAYKRWDKVGSQKYPEGNNSDEIGRVYGFAGINPTEVAYGKFVRAVTNVAINPLRAYLKYTGDLPVNCKNALCKPAAEEVYEPSENIVFRIVESASIPDDPQGNQDDDLTSVQKMPQIPAVLKANRWYDFNGRSLIKKPDAHGAYINDRTSVIVK